MYPSGLPIMQDIFTCFGNGIDEDRSRAEQDSKVANALSAREECRLGETAAKNQDTIRRFAWVINSVGVHLEELRYFWAKALGISGPQWMILMALADLDDKDGVPVNVVSKKLHVDPSFVTTQSKLLEKKGFLRRKTSTEDARVVQMSLTDKTYKQMAGLAAQQEALNEFIFAELSNKQLDELIDTLSGLRNRLEKGRLKVIADA
jgi:MarR family transcriptional regulator, organic hydroperoxide resistance regulator